MIHSENRIERVENVKDVEQYIDRIGEMIDRKRQLYVKKIRFIRVRLFPR